MYFTSFLYLPCVKFIYDSHRNRKVMISYTRSVASFSTSCRPGWPRFPHILNIARMSSAYWPHQHFELLSFLADPTIHNTAISRKVVGKSARDNAERHCGWFWVLFFFFKESWKNWYERLCKCVCECQRKATKVGSTATVVRNLVLIISHITFRDCRVHIFSDNLSRNSCILQAVEWSNQKFVGPGL